MPKRQNPQFKRPASFIRPAFRADMDRLTYARIPKAVVHPWARPIVDDLSPAANKVYSLLISLAMTGKKGYPGLAEPDDYACKIVRKITDQKCQLSTWRNGRRELVKKGLVSRTWWTRPDQKIQNGNRVVTVPGGQRVHKRDNEWCTKQIRITLLTPAGAGLFDSATRLEKSHILAQLPTPLKNSARSQIEDGSKSPNGLFASSLKPTPCDDVTTQLTCNRRLDHEPSTSQSSKDCASPDKEGKPTRRPASTASKRPTVEHGHDKQSTVASARASSKGASKGSFEGFKPPFSGQRGVTAERPTVPRGKKGKSKNYAKTRLLNVLHQCLANYPKSEADRIWERATTEIELSTISNWPTVINLQYWLSRAKELTRREMFGYMRSRVIPGLRWSDLVVPTEPKRYKEWTERPPAPTKLETPINELPAFLQTAARRFCLE